MLSCFGGWICKSYPKNWSPTYFWTLLKLHSCTTQKHQTHGYRCPSFLSQMAFCWPCQTFKVHYRSMGPVNGINKDMNGDRLLPTTVVTYPVDWVYLCHLLKTQYCCCLCPNGGTQTAVLLLESACVVLCNSNPWLINVHTINHIIHYEILVQYLATCHLEFKTGQSLTLCLY